MSTERSNMGEQETPKGLDDTPVEPGGATGAPADAAGAIDEQENPRDPETGKPVNEDGESFAGTTEEPDFKTKNDEPDAA
jgi:hypothetical protein